MKKIFIFIGILILVGFAYYLTFDKMVEEPLTEEEPVGLANPASVFCFEQEGALKNIEFPAGEDGLCVFEDNSVCWQWDLYRGDCFPGELKIETFEPGTGKLAQKGDTVIVHYSGVLEDGTKFDSSWDRNEPFAFTLGFFQVIPGWEQGILGMQEGEKRKLTIGPNLAYGDADIDTIPPQSILIFEVELLEIR